jgi:hypothetical protein
LNFSLSNGLPPYSFFGMIIDLQPHNAAKLDANENGV